MAPATGSDESDLDRVVRLIDELDGEESLLLGLDADPTQANPAVEAALLDLHARRSLLEEELAAVWAKRCSQC